MKTTTFSQALCISASPHEVFEALMDAKQNAEFTGAPAVIERKPGGKYSLFGGQLVGSIVSFEQDRSLVKRLRSVQWPKDVVAETTYTLSPLEAGRRTYVWVVETGFPAEHLEEIKVGWRQGLWDKLEGHLRSRKLAVLDHYVAEYKNRANLDAVDVDFTPDVALHLPVPGLPQGREGMRLNGKALHSMLSGIHVERDVLVQEGDEIAERATGWGIHTGDLSGVAPTGKKVFWTEIHIYRFKDGKISAVWSEADFFGMIQQVGPELDGHKTVAPPV